MYLLSTSAPDSACKSYSCFITWNGNVYPTVRGTQQQYNMWYILQARKPSDLPLLAVNGR